MAFLGELFFMKGNFFPSTVSRKGLTVRFGEKFGPASWNRRSLFPPRKSTFSSAFFLFSEADRDDCHGDLFSTSSLARANLSRPIRRTLTNFSLFFFLHTHSLRLLLLSRRQIRIRSRAKKAVPRGKFGLRKPKKSRGLRTTTPGGDTNGRNLG